MQINKIAIGVREPINSRVRFRNRTQHTRSLVLGVRGVVWEDLSRTVRDNRFLSGINEQEAKNSIQDVALFPNPTPFSQTVKIVSSVNDNLDISLFDITGRKVQHIFSGRSQIGDNDFSVNLSGLATGFYIYRIQNGQQTKYIKTIKN